MIPIENDTTYHYLRSILDDILPDAERFYDNCRNFDLIHRFSDVLLDIVIDLDERIVELELHDMRRTDTGSRPMSLTSGGETEQMTDEQLLHAVNEAARQYQAALREYRERMKNSQEE